MARIGIMKYSRPFNLGSMSVNIWENQRTTESLSSEENWVTRQNEIKKIETELTSIYTYLEDNGERHEEYKQKGGGDEYIWHLKTIHSSSEYITEEQKNKSKQKLEELKKKLTPEQIELFECEYQYNQNLKQRDKLEDKLSKECGIYGFDYEQAKSIHTVYNTVRNDPEKLEKFKKIYALMLDMSENEWAKDGTINQTFLAYNNNVQTLRVRNLGGSGLNVAFNEDLSFVFEKEGSLTEEQVQIFANFAEEHEINIDDFSGIKDLKITNKNGEEIGTFEQVYNDYIDLSEYAGMKFDELQKKLESCDGYQEYENNRAELAKLCDMKNRTADQQKRYEDLKVAVDSFEPKLRRAMDIAEIQGGAVQIEGTNAPGHEEDDLEHEGVEARERTPGQQAEGKIENGSTDTVDDDGKASFSAILANSDDKINDDMTFREMSKPIMARAGIARIDKKCCVRRRLPDGSYMIAWYGSETDKYKDCKIDPKTGIAQHTKKVAFILRKNPPRIGIYLPQGAKFEGSYAKATLGTIKAMGYKYFKMPSAVEFGGDACGAFWEAAGDQLVCPLLKRSANDDGCSIGNDDLTKLLKAMKEKNNLDESQEIEFKMRLVEELKHHTAYLRATEKPNSSLETTMKGLEGDARFYHFSKSVLPNLDDKITEGVRNGKWNAVDIACAHKAQAEIIKAVEKGMITYTDSSGRTINQPYDYLHPDMSAINMMFECEMKKAEPEVIEWFKTNCKPGAVKDDDPTYGDDDDQINGFKQNDFNTYSQKLVMEYRDIATKAFKDMASKYPGSEKITDKTEPVQIKVVPTLDMNRDKSKGDAFANLKPGRQGASTSSPSGRAAGSVSFSR